MEVKLLEQVGLGIVINQQGWYESSLSRAQFFIFLFFLLVSLPLETAEHACGSLRWILCLVNLPVNLSRVSPWRESLCSLG